MTDATAILIASAVGTAIAAVAVNLPAIILAIKTKDQIDELKRNVKSTADDVIKAKGEAEHAKGVTEGVAAAHKVLEKDK